MSYYKTIMCTGTSRNIPKDFILTTFPKLGIF